jgi:hypothetical protein
MQAHFIIVGTDDDAVVVCLRSRRCHIRCPASQSSDCRRSESAQERTGIGTNIVPQADKAQAALRILVYRTRLNPPVAGTLPVMRLVRLRDPSAIPRRAKSAVHGLGGPVRTVFVAEMCVFNGLWAGCACDCRSCER